MTRYADHVSWFALSWIYGDPPDPDVLEWALTGPWPACPRCGVELKQVRRRTHGWREEIGHPGHCAPCGQRCLPGLDSWVGDCGAPHVSNATCWKCKELRDAHRLPDGH